MTLKIYATWLMGLAVSCLPAAAQATYIYTGQNFTQVQGSVITTSDHITATLQVTNPLPPNLTCANVSGYPGFSLTMSDGKTGSAQWPGGQTFRFVGISTDGSGAIIAPWTLSLQFTDLSGRDRVIRTIQTPTTVCGYIGSQDDSAPNGGGSPSGQVSSSPGTWSSPPPAVQLTQLKTQFQVGNLPDIGTSFSDQLQQVLNDLASGNGLACTDLQTFVSHVKAQSRKKLSQAQADGILQIVANVLSQLNCVN